jgi:hypothetical protein
MPANRRVAKSKVSKDFLTLMLLTLIHLPLGIALYSTGSAGVLHPLLVFAIGLYAALKKKVNLGHVTFVVAYIVGAEVLWRMAGVPAPWEFGKYASATILLVAIFRCRRFDVPKLPALYFVLLIPACIMVIAAQDMSRASAELSFNISGPFVLFVSCWFFYKCRLSPSRFRRLLFAFILPLLSVALAALFHTVTAENLTFDGESNFTTSGGFGPNQVSAMLGLGVFVSVAGVLSFKKSVYSLYFVVTALLFSALCVMTFSRGGMYNAIGGIIIMLLFGLRDFSAGLKRVVPALVLGAMFMLLIYPMLDDFTGGALQDRFEDTGTTQRAEIATADVDIFMENPVFGIGVGASYIERQRFLHKAMSHTEFSRLVSEHGSFGLMAILAMVVMLVGNLTRPNSTPGRAFIAGMMAWACFFMMNSGMRLAAPSFIWGLGFVTIVTQRPSASTLRRRLAQRGMIDKPVKLKKAFKPA